MSAPEGADGGVGTPQVPDPGGRPSDGQVSGTLHSILLLGEDYAELEEIRIRDLTPKVAIGISRGRFPKGYPHVDPNEDSVFAAIDGTTTILAVADGHHGFDAARAAMLAIAEAAPQFLNDSLEDVVYRLATSATEAVSKAVPPLPSPRDTSRTSLTIAAIRDNAVAATTIGDTALFVVAGRRMTRLGIDSGYVSSATDPTAIEVISASFSHKAMLILTSDGFLDFAADPKAALRAAASLRACDAVDHLISEAFSGGAGDNLAIAVHTGP